MNISVLVEVSMEFTLMLLITLIQTLFYFKTIGSSKKWRGLILALVILFFAFIEAAIQLAAINIQAFSSWGSLVFVISFFYPIFFMGGKYKERILFGIVAIAIFMFSILLTGSILHSENLIINSPKWLGGLQISAIIILIYFILVLFVTHLSTEGKHYIPHKYWVGIIISFLIVCVGLEVVVGLRNWIEDSEKILTYQTVFSLGLLVIWLILYFAFYFICRYFTKSAEANMLAVQYHIIEQYMLRKQASDEHIRILSHDLKHSLTQWRVLAEEKGDSNALQSITEYEGQLYSSLLINVENETANAIINQRYWEAKQARIGFLTDGVFCNDLIISKLDLCSLLGNLLENAIEATTQVETNALRRIKLTIRRKGNLLVLAVENGYAIEPVLENGEFVTNKNDKEHHAIGMRSIKYVADKYDGVVNNSYKNNWFKATVMLRGYKNAPSDEN